MQCMKVRGRDRVIDTGLCFLPSEHLIRPSLDLFYLL